MKKIMLFLLVCISFFVSDDVRAQADGKAYVSKITITNDSGAKVGFGIVLKGKDTSLFKGEFHEDAVLVFIAPGGKYTFDKVPEKTVYVENKVANVVYRMVGVGFPTNNYAQSFDAASGELKIQLKPQLRANPNPIMGMLGEDPTYEISTCADTPEETSDDGIAPEQEVTDSNTPDLTPQPQPTHPQPMPTQLIPTQPTPTQDVTTLQSLRYDMMMFAPL